MEGEADGKDGIGGIGLIEVVKEREELTAIKINKKPLIFDSMRLQNSVSPSPIKSAGIETPKIGGIKLGVPQLRQTKPYNQFRPEMMSERNKSLEP